ncbi:MAG: 50S ribosomal protein L28 [Planctomycetota bacterium]
MGRTCDITGARTTRGNKVRYRGKAKYLGGIGKKVTSISRRTFKPNLQTVNAEVDGKPRKLRVTTRAIKSGLVTKPAKRKYTYTREQKAQAESDASS